MVRAASGGSSLGIHLGQSIILTTLFSACGFGLWGEVDRLTATAIGRVRCCACAAIEREKC